MKVLAHICEQYGLSLGSYGRPRMTPTGLPGRIDKGGQGAAGTAISTASETLRTVAAVQAALTNTAGVTASIGFSKSKSTSATQESVAVGSNIAGGTVNITATDTDIIVRGSDVSASGDIALAAKRDVILESAQNTLGSQFKSSSSSASIGVSVSVAVVGGVTASAVWGPVRPGHRADQARLPKQTAMSPQAVRWPLQRGGM